jgi:hypothetical protein
MEAGHMVQVKSKLLPGLDEFSKKIVNEGRYNLYKIKHPTAKFALDTGEGILLLDEHGDIVGRVPQLQSVSIEENVYFEDLEFPPSTNAIRAASAG